MYLKYYYLYSPLETPSVAEGAEVPVLPIFLGALGALGALLVGALGAFWGLFGAIRKVQRKGVWQKVLVCAAQSELLEWGQQEKTRERLYGRGEAQSSLRGR